MRMRSESKRDAQADARVDTQVLIIGAGFAGLCVAIQLKKAGLHDFVVLERGAEVGGTWRDNTYPGAACDIESVLYAYSFEPNAGWTRTFATQPEILAYLVRCADKYAVRPHVRFGTDVLGAAYQEQRGCWEVSTGDGRALCASVLVLACGALSRPLVPELAGSDVFQGRVFHSARWDHSFDFARRRVAIVGTGASGVQIVPAIADRVERLYVFQRTAPWILPRRPDRPRSARMRALLARAPAMQAFARDASYWAREAIGAGFLGNTRVIKLLERIGRSYLQRSVRDAALRAKLEPTHQIGCKRIVPTNHYYRALQRPNVEVVTERIARLSARGVVTDDGVEREVDGVVLATGFQAAEACAPFDMRGRGGRSLVETWHKGAEAFLGTAVAGFPNAFMILGPNTHIGHSSMILMIEAQVRYVVSAIETMGKLGLKSVEVKRDVQDRYNEELRDRLDKTVWASGCRSWYKTSTGKITMQWPGFTTEFATRTRRFDPQHYTLEASGAARAADLHRDVVGGRAPV